MILSFRESTLMYIFRWIMKQIEIKIESKKKVEDKVQVKAEDW